jgi:hypothetical protein
VKSARRERFLNLPGDARIVGLHGAFEHRFPYNPTRRR